MTHEGYCFFETCGKLTFISDDGMQHDLVGRLRRVEAVSFTPIVAHGVGENVACSVKVSGTDGPADFGITLQTVFGIFVPEMEGAVGAGGAEGAVDGMEVDGVDRVHVARVAVVGRGLAVAFEAEIVALVFVLDVLHGAAAFDATDCETCAIGEGGDDASLEFEWRLERLEERLRLFQVNDVDPTVCGADDQHLIANIHRIDAVTAFQCCGWLLLAQIPVFDHLVPAARD